MFEQPLPREDHGKRKGSKKKRGREEEPIFIGWRFAGAPLTYNVRDACQTFLPELFLKRAAARVAAKI